MKLKTVRNKLLEFKKYVGSHNVPGAIFNGHVCKNTIYKNIFLDHT